VITGRPHTVRYPNDLDAAITNIVDADPEADYSSVTRTLLREALEMREATR
jgi:Arc/MetJ-type ribon-helix-helix transcriptional regulator